MSLKSEMLSLLDNALHLCCDCPDGASFSDDLKELRARLEQPLRVAVVGIMKAGKSTFLNALMNADILYTGDLETTYTVCWFRYGETPALTIYFRNGEQTDAPFEDLGKWSVRTYEAENPRIDDVKYLVIHYPSEVLKTMEFIDTPGLNSVYGTDAQNTLDFLSIQGSENTLYEAGMADAVVYAFSPTARGFDQDILQGFQGSASSGMSPINSVGILTKVDSTGIWNVFDEDPPRQAALPVSDSIMKSAGMNRLIFTVLPVCAKVCEGFAQLETRDWETLKKIAAIDLHELRDLLSDARQFSCSEDEIYENFGDVMRRTRLIQLLGQYGILEIAEQIRQGKTPAEIDAALQETCGIQNVRELLVRHFGNRTFLIKTQYIFNHLKSKIAQIRHDGTSSLQLKNVCGQLMENIDGLMVSVQTLKELKALQMYYNGQLKFSDDEELQDFLRITGEYGRTVEMRLGVRESLPVAKLAQLAHSKVGLWHGKAACGWMVSGAYVEAASIIARSYEQIYYHLSSLCEE